MVQDKFRWKSFKNTRLWSFQGENFFWKFSLWIFVYFNEISKKKFENFKCIKKFFFAQETKWWVMRSLGSFVKKFLHQTQAEEMHLKIFLKAHFLEVLRLFRFSENSCRHILRNFELKFFITHLKSVFWIHKVPLFFWSDDPLIL